MPRGTYLSENEKGQIDGMRRANPDISVYAIAKALDRSFTVVNNYLANPGEYGTKSGNAGRKPKLSDRDKRNVVRTAANAHRTHQVIYANQIASQLNLSVSRQTIYRTLNDSTHFDFSQMQKAPRLEQVHRDARLEFARNNMSRNWNYVSFTRLS